jgi:hypothetical protein
MSDRPQLPQPDYRATLSGGRLTLVRWQPYMLGRRGPGNRLLHQGQIAPIADLTIVRDALERRDLIVVELTGRRDQRLRHELVRWATLLDYQRLWFDDEVIALDGSAAGAGRRVETNCPTCSAGWSDDAAEFWLGAHCCGAFPLQCPLCGHTLPQWSAATERLADASEEHPDARGDLDGTSDLATEPGGYR